MGISQDQTRLVRTRRAGPASRTLFADCSYVSRARGASADCGLSAGVLATGPVKPPYRFSSATTVKTSYRAPTTSGSSRAGHPSGEPTPPRRPLQGAGARSGVDSSSKAATNPARGRRPHQPRGFPAPALTAIVTPPTGRRRSGPQQRLRGRANRHTRIRRIRPSAAEQRLIGSTSIGPTSGSAAPALIGTR
jgi:hypothetical protein